MLFKVVYSWCSTEAKCEQFVMSNHIIILVYIQYIFSVYSVYISHIGTVVVKDFIWERWTNLFRKRQGRHLHFCNDLCFIEINYIKNSCFFIIRHSLINIVCLQGIVSCKSFLPIFILYGLMQHTYGNNQSLHWHLKICFLGLSLLY